MRFLRRLAGLCVAAVALAGSSKAEDVSLATVPPVVVKTVPPAGATDVDPATTEIKVTFSKEMTDGSWSWIALSKATFPPTAGDPKYSKDKRTCTLPVKLKPGKTYAVGINDEKHVNFKDAEDRPAFPYIVVFKTRK